MNCRACDTQIRQFFSLGDIPLVNSFLRPEDIEKEKRYDLSVGFCPNCYLVQLTKTIDPAILFRDYVYFSSVSKKLVNYFSGTADYLIKRLGLNKDSLVIELASNDGIFLQFFKDKDIGILGIDPARNIAEVANSKGIKTIAEFFNLELANRLVKEQSIQADLVYGANVLAHVPDIRNFVSGVKRVLAPEGTAVFEFPYLLGLMEGKFDIIYHEHVFYYSLLALRNLFNSVGLNIYAVEMVPMQGGSLRIFACHEGVFPTDESVSVLVEEELAKGFDKLETYQAVSDKAMLLKTELVTLLKELKQQGMSIAGYGAPAKGNVLLNYFQAGGLLDFITDDAEVKQGLYTPGTHLRVYSSKKIETDKPDYVLILPWNIVDEIIGKLENYLEAGGKAIIPIPKIEVIDKDNKSKYLN